MNVSEIRQDFPILSQTIHGKHPLVYFDNAATTQRPQVVIDAMDECYRGYYANVHRGNHHLSVVASEHFESARKTVANFVGVTDASQIVFTSGTTSGINLVARSWCDEYLRPGDEILLTILEHHSNIVPWQQAATRVGAKVRFCPLDSDGKFNLETWLRLLTDRTKVASFTALSNVLGTSLPTKAMVTAAKSRNILTVVDAAQLVPHEATNFEELGSDFVAFSGHKMLGPTGIGVLYGRRAILEKIPAFMGGGSMIDRVTTEGFTPGELPAKFEAGTPPIVEAVGLAAAIRYLQSIGLSNIAEHEKRLSTLARSQLSKIDGLKFLGVSPPVESGIVTIAFDDLAAQDLAILLDLKGIAVRAGHHCTMPLHDALGISASLRASFYFYNTEREVEYFVDQLRQIVAKLRR